MIRKQWALGGLFVAVVAGVLVWGILALEDRPAFVMAYLGLLANLVMGGAALLAFTLWRQQMRGATEHECARSAIRSAFAVEEAVWSSAQAARNLFEWVKNGGDPEELVARLGEWTQKLQSRLDALSEGIVEVRVVFAVGHTMAMLDLYNVAFEWSFMASRGGPKLFRGWKESADKIRDDEAWVRIFAGDKKSVAKLYADVGEHVAAIELLFDPHVGTDRAKWIARYEAGIAAEKRASSAAALAAEQGPAERRQEKYRIRKREG